MAGTPIFHDADARRVRGTPSAHLTARASAPGSPRRQQPERWSESTQVDLEILHRHRAIWTRRPELRAVYQAWFRELLESTDGRTPLVELGGGPGFFKEYHGRVISTDVLPSPWVDLACDALALPFRSASVGGLIMLDVLHHLWRPLDFLAEAARVLRPGGRLGMIEPWITPFSFLMYRYLHHEDCAFVEDVARPFTGKGKRAFDGNATIPYQVVRRAWVVPLPLRLKVVRPFVGVPYLFTFGFQREGPLPSIWLGGARLLDRFLRPFTRLMATRVLLVWEKPGQASAEEVA